MLDKIHNMDNSRIEVYKIICGNKTFRQTAIEKIQNINQSTDDVVFNGIFGLFLRTLTNGEIFSSNSTNLGLALFHNDGEEPNTILTSHSNNQIIEGYIDGGPYDRLRKVSLRDNTTRFSTINRNEIVTDRYYIYMHLPLGSSCGLLFLERKKGQDIHKPVEELVKQIFRTNRPIKLERYVPQSLIDDYKENGIVDTFSFSKEITSTVPDEDNLVNIEESFDVSIQIKPSSGSSYDSVENIMQQIGNFAMTIGNAVTRLSEFPKKKAKITHEGHGYTFNVTEDMKIRPSVEVPAELHDEDNGVLYREQIKRFCDSLRQQIAEEVYPV